MPVTRTYIEVTSSQARAPRVHVRVYSPRHDLDRRGTARSVDQARSRALAGLGKPR